MIWSGRHPATNFRYVNYVHQKLSRRYAVTNDNVLSSTYNREKATFRRMSCAATMRSMYDPIQILLRIMPLVWISKATLFWTPKALMKNRSNGWILHQVSRRSSPFPWNQQGRMAALIFRGGEADDSQSAFFAESDGEADGGNVDSDDEDTDDTEDEDSKEEDTQGESVVEKKEHNSSSSATNIGTSTAPVKVQIRTGLQCPLIDQRLDLTCSRSRDVLSIKQRISRQMRGRPPVSMQRLILLGNGGKMLQDDVLLSDIVPDSNEDEEEDEDDDGAAGSDGLVKISFTLDVVPPIDGKFATDDFGDLLKRMTTDELLDSYCSNVAAMHYSSMSLMKELDEIGNHMQRGRTEAEDSSIYTKDNDDFSQPSSSASLAMRRHALLVKEQLLSNFPEGTYKEIWKDTSGDNECGEEVNGMNDGGSRQRVIARGQKTRNGIRGGATMNVKRAVQHNLNINWADTIRNSLLFLFFGHFGARQAMSRLLMLMAAPLCFIIQLRPVKIMLKQLFYFVGRPPAILLSLLPAPQQAIMGLDSQKALFELYGDPYKSTHGSEEGNARIVENDDIELTADSDESEYEDEYNEEL